MKEINTLYDSGMNNLYILLVNTKYCVIRRNKKAEPSPLSYSIEERLHRIFKIKIEQYKQVI